MPDLVTDLVTDLVPDFVLSLLNEFALKSQNFDEKFFSVDHISMSCWAMIMILTGGKHMYSTYPEHIHMIPEAYSFLRNSTLNFRERIFLKFSK